MEIKKDFSNIRKAAQFFTTIAETEVSFAKVKEIIVGGISYEVRFESQRNHRTDKANVQAYAVADGEICAFTPWQDSEYAELSAFYSLRHALENFNRPLFKPNAGDVVRLNLEGRQSKGVIAGESRWDNGILVAETDELPYLSGSNLLFRNATLRSFDEERFYRRTFQEELKVWRHGSGDTAHESFVFTVNKPLWVVS